MTKNGQGVFWIDCATMPNSIWTCPVFLVNCGRHFQKQVVIAKTTLQWVSFEHQCFCLKKCSLQQNCQRTQQQKWVWMDTTVNCIWSNWVHSHLLTVTTFFQCCEQSQCWENSCSQTHTAFSFVLLCFKNDTNIDHHNAPKCEKRSWIATQMQNVCLEHNACWCYFACFGDNRKMFAMESWFLSDWCKKESLHFLVNNFLVVPVDVVVTTKTFVCAVNHFVRYHILFFKLSLSH